MVSRGWFREDGIERMVSNTWFRADGFERMVSIGREWSSARVGLTLEGY